MDEKYWSNLEKLYVHDVYDEISPYYDDQQFCANLGRRSSSSNYINVDHNNVNNDKNNSTKSKSSTTAANNLKVVQHNAWRKVKLFLLELKPYSLIADIGCGNGKYLNCNPTVYTIGCDRCNSLASLAKTQAPNTPIVICDNLYLPFRSNLFDAVISIGVIHHFSTKNRRIKAIKELCRILKPGGKLMIYVWALEQKLRKFDSQDILVPSLKGCSKADNTNNNDTNNNSIIRSRHWSTSSLTDNKDRNDDEQNSSLASSTTNIDNNNNNNNNCLIEIKHMANKIQDNFGIENNNNTATTDSSSTMSSNANKSRILQQSISVDETLIYQRPTNLTSNAENRKGLISSITDFLSNKLAFNSNKPIIKRGEKAFFRQQSETTFSPNTRNGFDYYNYLIDLNKESLPEGFKIRKFPMSSYENTFTNTTSETSSPTTPTAPATSGDESNPTSNNNNNNNNNNYEMNTTNLTHKRYYHVFKANELDELIQHNCEDMYIYKSYYDHANWCICAQKKY